MASPSGRQKGINDFFSVTGVITSSPSKSTQSGSAAQSSAFDLNSSIEMDDDDDDVSLLAAVDMNGDIDDASLLAAMEDEGDVDRDDDVSLLATESQAQQETVADHLEGMTPEMFGADDVFDDEVEALPDAHYGLLGGRKDLLQPQGCMDDLPEEILRQILCEIPARDLYRSVSLVCLRWRNIILDPKVDTHDRRLL